jgi:hypothetical protein
MIVGEREHRRRRDLAKDFSPGFTANSCTTVIVMNGWSATLKFILECTEITSGWHLTRVSPIFLRTSGRQAGFLLIFIFKGGFCYVNF